jgi:hypothetical protein
MFLMNFISFQIQKSLNEFKAWTFNVRIIKALKNWYEISQYDSKI